MVECGFEVSELESQLHSNVYFRTNAFSKGIETP